MATKATMGELQDFADEEGIEYDEDISYEEMRDRVEIFTCDNCGDEHFGRYPAVQEGKFCSDSCEAQYIDENF